MHKSLWILALVVSLGFIGCGGDSGPGAAGTYELDTAAMASALAEEGLKKVPEAMRVNAEVLAEAKAEAEKQAAAMTLSCTVNADGTWVTVGDMGFTKVDGKGTWTLDGEKMTITTTENKGAQLEKPKSLVATLKDGVITLTPEGAPFPIRLVRK